MLTITHAQYDALSAVAENEFLERVRRFLESDYPEFAGLDVETSRRNARTLIERAKQCGLQSEPAILKLISMLLDYFVHDPQAYKWAHDLLSNKNVSEAEKMLGLENRLYGAPKWA